MSAALASVPPAGSVEFEAAGKRYDGEPAIEDVSLRLAAGSFTAFVGPSGCGKTTLLNMLAGLILPDTGRVCVSGQPIAGTRTDTALLFQQYNLFPWMTALDNVAFALENRGETRRAARAQALQLLKRVGLDRFAHCTPAQLSGGMQQRVALVRAFALAPRLLLLDEPFAALDQETRRVMHAYLLSTWSATSATVVMVTHDLGEALALADQVAVFSRGPGRLVEVVTVDAPRPRHRPREPRRSPRPGRCRRR